MGSFIKVAKAAEVPAGGGRLVQVAGKQIALFQVEGKYFAIDNTCTHVGGPLSEGEVEGAAVECPWHGSRFSLETGKVLYGPALTDVACYPVRREGDDIEIEVGT